MSIFDGLKKFFNPKPEVQTEPEEFVMDLSALTDFERENGIVIEYNVSIFLGLDWHTWRVLEATGELTPIGKSPSGFYWYKISDLEQIFKKIMVVGKSTTDTAIKTVFERREYEGLPIIDKHKPKPEQTDVDYNKFKGDRLPSLDEIKKMFED